jgi:hypothetical protein
MKHVLLVTLCLAVLVCGNIFADQPKTVMIVDRAIQAVGGPHMLLSRFMIQERLNVSNDSDKPGKGHIIPGGDTSLS